MRVANLWTEFSAQPIDFPRLLVIPRYFIYLALARWIAVSLGLIGTLIKNTPRVTTKQPRAEM
jgi:hypothetical protein